MSGFNVHPVEVEEVVMEHAAVKEAAAVGVPDAVDGRGGQGVRVLRPDAVAAPDRPRLIRFCADRLARYKCPDVGRVRRQIPAGFAGKLLRRSLG